MLLCCSQLFNTCTHRNMHAHTRSIKKTRLCVVCCTYFVCCTTNDETFASTCKSCEEFGSFSLGFILFSCSFHLSFKMSNLFFFILSAPSWSPRGLKHKLQHRTLPTWCFTIFGNCFIITCVSIQQVHVSPLFSRVGQHLPLFSAAIRLIASSFQHTKQQRLKKRNLKSHFVFGSL